MSGHSKWSQIKRQKGVADQKRGTVFTKLAHKVTLAAREGGGNPEMNYKLRLVIEKAREANMPKDNIDRAIKRGIGELEGTRIEEVIYEGFGPEGTAFLIEAVTDNKNRTTSEVRSTFSKYGGNLGSANSVQWMFEKKGVIRLFGDTIKNREEAELALIEAGALDIDSSPEGVTVYTLPEQLTTLKAVIEKQGLTPTSAELEFVAKDTVTLPSTEAQEKCQKLFDALETLDDVAAVHANF